MFIKIDDDGYFMLNGYDRVELCKIANMSERELCKMLGKSKSYLRYYRGNCIQPQEVLPILINAIEWKKKL